MTVQEIESIENIDKLTELRTELDDKLKEIAAETIMDIKPLENTKVKFEIELIIPAPYIPDYFNKLGKAKFFSKIDLKEAYYQIQNAESVIEFTAFICTTVEIGRLNTTAGHLECDGVSERNVQTIKAMIRAHVLEDQSNWDVGRKELSFAYNTCVHEWTRVTPYYATFGSHPRIPIDIIFQPRKRGRKRKSQQFREVVDNGNEGILLDSGHGDSVPVVTRGGRVSKPVRRYQA